MKNKRLIIIFVAIVILLMIPLIAMQFTDEVNWTGSDFIVMGILLSGAGLLIEIIMRKIKTANKRILVIGAILIIFLLIWAELGVGIFGTPFAGS